MATLAVMLGVTRVGWLESFEDFNYRFSFDPDWLADPARPILGQLFEDRRPVAIETSGLPCWFAHLLPQGPLRRFILTNTIVSDDDDDNFVILRMCAEDLPGGVVLVEAESPLPRRPVEPWRPTEVEGAYHLRFALAGQQWKLSIRQGERGLVIPARGESGEWIAKFSDPQHPRLPEIEFATTELARACGLWVPETRLVTLDAFDALPVGLHGEVGPVYLTQLVFDLMVGNGDAHLKNWSVQYLAKLMKRPAAAVHRQVVDMANTVRARWQDGADGFLAEEHARLDAHIEQMWRQLGGG